MAGSWAVADCKAASLTAELPNPQAAGRARGASHITFLITTVKCTRLESFVIHLWCELSARRSWVKGRFPSLKKLHTTLIPALSHLSPFPKCERAEEESKTSASR